MAGVGKEVRLDIDEEAVGGVVSISDGVPQVKLPSIVVSGVNDAKSIQEIEEEVKENCMQAVKKIKKAVNVSRFPLKISIALLVLYAAVFAVSCYVLGYARGVAITNICVAMVTKLVGKVLQFKPLQRRIEAKLRTLEETASSTLRSFLDEFVTPLHKAQESIKTKMDDVEAVLENKNVVQALEAASIAGFDANAPLGLVEEVDGYVAEAGELIDDLISTVESLRSYVKLASRFNGAVAAFAAIYIIFSGAISTGIYYSNDSGDAGVAVAVNAAIGFGVFVVTLIEHVLISWILKRIVAFINVCIEKFEALINERIKAAVGGEGPSSIGARIKRAAEIETTVKRVAKAAKAAGLGKGLVGGVKKLFKGLL